MSKLEKIEGVGESFAKKLHEAGVTTTDSLLERGSSKEGRKEIAEKSGISEKNILKWVNQVDLARIKGISEEYGELLEVSGVDSYYGDLRVLRKISLAVNEGEIVALLGPNGHGKSTLLKAISGILKCAEGNITVNGKIAPLIELQAGFDLELTGRENIYLNASMLGFSKKKIDKSFDSIIDFSELSDFVDTPLKNYSSGMIARLGFSIAITVNPDILLIDEMLTVGDAHFNQKSHKRILEDNQRGVTILFVSHIMEEIRSICSKVLWLDHGRLKMIGKPEEVITEYELFMQNTSL